jgi:hypothetical protein
MRRVCEFGRLACGIDGAVPDVLHPGAVPDVFHARLREADAMLRLRLPADLAEGLLAAIESARAAAEVEAAAVPWDAPWPPAGATVLAAPAGATILAAPAGVSVLAASGWASRVEFVRGRRVPMWVGLLLLLEEFAATWDNDAGAPERHDDRVYVRDGWRCAAPGCSSRRHLEDHHIVYRSRGGDDGMANRITLCRFHHQRGEHGGLMSVRGSAPLGLSWRLGRADVAVGYGAERRYGGDEEASNSNDGKIDNWS